MTTDPDLLKRAFSDVLDIQEVLPIEGDAFLTFEYNGGGHDYLGEGAGHGLVRGANSTSTDAAFRYLNADGVHELALVEWKYTEQYLGSKLSADRKGVREKRYRGFWDDPAGPIEQDAVPYEGIFVEPLYQLVRQQLLASRIETSQSDPAQVVRVIHIAPATNQEYWRSLDRHPRRLQGETVREVWERMLRPSRRDRFRSIDSARFTDPARALTSASYRARYGHS